MNNQIYSRRNVILMVSIITLIVLLLPHLIRSVINTSLIGDLQYHNLKIAEDIANNNLDWSRYDFNLIHYILAYLPAKTLFARIIPLVLGMISLILLYLILSKFKYSEEQKFIILALSAITPYFIYYHTHYTSHSFIILFNLLSTYFLIEKRFISCIIVLLPVLFINLPSVILSIILLLVISLIIGVYDETKYYFAGLFGTSILVYFLFYYGSFIPNIFFFTKNPLFSNLVTDFGAKIGITIFHLLLAFIGIIILWVTDKRYKFYYVMFMFLFLLSTYFEYIGVFLCFFFAIFGSYVIISLEKRRWELKDLKGISVMLIIYGLLFSAISFETRLVNDSPRVDEINLLKWLERADGDIVFSNPKNTYLLEYFSGKKNIIARNYIYLDDADTLVNDVDQIYYSRNLQKTKDLLDKYNITYIYITSDMKNGLVWEKRDEGLLFLLDNSDDFVRILELGQVELWYYIP